MKLQIPCSSYTWRFCGHPHMLLTLLTVGGFHILPMLTSFLMPEVCYSDIWRLLWIFAHAWGMCGSGLITHSPYAWRLLSEPHIWCMLNSFTLSSFGWLLTPEILVDTLWESQSYHPILYGQRKYKFCTCMQVVTWFITCNLLREKSAFYDHFFSDIRSKTTSAETPLVVVNLSILR